MESHVFPLPPHSLLCCAHRYVPSTTKSDGLTLIFTHGLGGHKELWTPTIEKLLQLSSNANYALREIWALDFTNHGQAAIHNRVALAKRNMVCTTMDYADMLRHFLATSFVKNHNIIVIAHSGSSTSWVFANRTAGRLPLTALILVEPTLMFPGMAPDDHRITRGNANVKGVLTRRDRWKDRESTLKYLSVRHPWKKWDPRVLQLHLDHGFMTVSADPETYFTPTLTKEEEAPLYLCESHIIQPSDLGKICSQMPVHVVWAEHPEFISPLAKEEILDAAERKTASVRTLPGAGHLVCGQIKLSLSSLMIPG
ncbi:Alpha/Beta hydrolase protein [Hygrophoropsis aurantiaca]|uniref:Alpha/Beta hydrolase protein n=1 Tax=Hygrophoropsis aurantiaca TaxID=72124 RepID=A0ACB8AIG9_9AGAM|nr:Alpha/Beta hydrolase protein [Hygrophoropsis aurantiaca]